MPLPAAVQAAFDALAPAAEVAQQQELCSAARVVDAYMNRRPLPRNDAQYKRMRREQQRQQRLAELDSLPVSERYGIRFDARAGLWVLYIDNNPAATSKDHRALIAAYPELLHQQLTEALSIVLNGEDQ